ncbi:Pentatricopeptide repeat-containing protein At1g28690, mitochondrial [Linum perenne]
MNNAKLLAIQPFLLSSTRFFNSFGQTATATQSIHQYIVFQTPATLSSALQHYINSTVPGHGRKIHAHILKTGFIPNTNVSIKLLILHLKTGCLKYGRQVFDELPQPTLSAYNYMIGGYLRQGLVEEAIGLVRTLLLGSDERPDGFTFSMILKASSVASSGYSGNVVLPRRLWSIVHGQIVRLDIEPDDVLYTAVVDSYVKAGNVGYARRVFDLMMDKNVICSTSMISGYMNYGSVEEAEEIFDRTEKKDIVVFNAMIEGYSKSEETALKALEFYIDMQRDGFRPNVSTFASVIGACSLLTEVKVGIQIQSQVMKICFTNIKIASALVDMYAKCGVIEDARRVFDYMVQKNVFSWSSMIDGYGKSGQPNKALELFSEMQQCGVEPNYVTFLAAISACGHGGLVAKGREIFESMERDYSLKPRMEHYACIVDMLGRAGCLHEAWELVMGMPKRPNSDVWAALLNSCNFHGSVEMASIAANELFKLNAKERPGAYVSFSNTLAAAGKWDSASQVRDVMKVRGVLKDTGSSWVGTETVQ